MISCQFGMASGLGYWEGSASSDLFKAMALSCFLGTKCLKGCKRISGQTSSVGALAGLPQRHWEHYHRGEALPASFIKCWLNGLSLLTQVLDHWGSETKICWSKTALRDGSSGSSFNLRMAQLLKATKIVCDTLMRLPSAPKIQARPPSWERKNRVSQAHWIIVSTHIGYADYQEISVLFETPRTQLKFETMVPDCCSANVKGASGWSLMRSKAYQTMWKGVVMDPVTSQTLFILSVEIENDA